MSRYKVLRADNIGPVVFTIKGHIAPLTVDGEGVLEIKTYEHNACIVAGGTVIKGVRLVTSDGEHPDYEVDNAANLSQFPVFMIVSAGAPLTIVHESGDVTELRERISVNDAASTVIDTKMVQVFFAPWLDRVWAMDWANV